MRDQTCINRYPGSRPAVSLRLLWPVALLMVLGISVLAGHVTTPVAAQVAAPQPAGFDRALNLIAQAWQEYQDVADYTCTLVKREVIQGQLQPENVIAMRVRSKPFSIHMAWLKPKHLEGQQVCFVTGKNNGMMRVKGAGLLGAVGFINMDPNDKRAQQTSRHRITEAGIGNLIERYAHRWLEESKQNRTLVRIGDYEFNKVKCVRVETSHPHSKPGDFYCYRSVIYFDKESHLPIRTEAYDWPRAGGKPEGELLECFSFVDLQVNVKLEDATFNY